MRSDDVSLKGILGFLAILVVTLVLIYVVITAMWHRYENRARLADGMVPAEATGARPYFPAPREQPNPVLDLRALQSSEAAELNSYGWIDRSNGVVRIPIDRAMDLIAQQPGRQP